MSYNFQELEQKWQNIWEKSNVFKLDINKEVDPFYLLVMFPYPSGDKLHMGHWFVYGLLDSWARFKRMNGKRVFFPMGFDAFGLPAENFAIKKGIHPDVTTTQNVKVMREQFRRMGTSYNWNYTLDTSKPDYYKWTQWVFLELYKKGLAYKKEAPVNWCTSCQTVLANEQVQDGRCDRCDSVVIRKNLSQWFFKITDYAQPLLDNIERLDWPYRTKAMQQNWIGRSEGTEIEFKTHNNSKTFTVYTTRPDTLFGVTYVTLAPEHPLVAEITTPEQRAAVDAYIDETSRVTEVDRLSTTREKTGVFTGAHAINPINGEKVPIWISDYVLYSYGTGAVMAVPAHDERDFAFAKKYKLPVRRVILEKDGNENSAIAAAFTEAGTMVASEKYNGMMSADAIRAITKELEEKRVGKFKVNFRLRDWLISRQRYWGAPIPIVNCKNCGEVAVPEHDLPVKLPEDVDFRPTGESPLKRCPSFINTTCPKCGGEAEREADTLDTFVCSSWYFLRFPNVGNNEKAFDTALTNRVLPVDKYVGGPEHACMHLLYARFINMVMKDLGHINFDEPFESLTHHGLVLGADGQKMSKSKGNTVSPDSYVEKHGSDVLRMYLAFGFNYIEGGPWDDQGIKSTARFLERAWRLLDENRNTLSSRIAARENTSSEDKKLLFVLHNSIRMSTRDIEAFQFNTSIARCMELCNALYEYIRVVPQTDRNEGLLRDALQKFIILLSPFVPHAAEEWWSWCGKEKSLFLEQWPTHSEEYLTLDETSFAIMINGKLRGDFKARSTASEDEIVALAKQQPCAQKHLAEATLVKHIFVPKKLVNFIVK
jgi:leucyl-tRNA synthetase